MPASFSASMVSRSATRPRPLSDASRFTASVRDQAFAALSRHLGREADSLSALIDAMPPTPLRPVRGRGTVTIAIPTRNRTASLQRLLDSIDELNYRDFTVLVVDNAPTTDSTYLMVRAAYAIGLAAPLRGRTTARGSHARNCALRAISSDFVLFADDDTVLDRADARCNARWVRARRKGRLRHRVRCVVGARHPCQSSIRSAFGLGYEVRPTPAVTRS